MTAPRRCTSRTVNGAACRAAVVPGRTVCRWHDRSPEAKAKHRAESKRGGVSKAYGGLPTAPSIADVLDMDTLDLETPAGSRALLAGALRQLARLPLDVRVANALAQVVTSQRNVIEASDIVRRLDALELTQSQRRPQ